jgi:phage terminase large subunit
MLSQAVSPSQRKIYREQGKWVPNPGPQEVAISFYDDPTVFEIFFGASRGPGKTAAGVAWLVPSLTNPRLRALVIRKNADDLSDWVDRAVNTYKPMKATAAYRPAIIKVPNGGTILTGHLKDDQAYTKYQGHEYPKMLIEELTQIPSEVRYKQLIASCRSTIPGLFPQVFLTANPGGVGHGWVKARFITPDRTLNDVEEVSVNYVDDLGRDRTYDYLLITDKETGLRRVYLPATIDDNPVLMQADPNYVHQLESLKNTDESLYRAWRHGDWDIFVGQVFDEWREKLHVIDKLGISFETFNNCKKIASLDWGYNDPNSVHWNILLPENDMGVKHIITYRERYENKRTPEDWAVELAQLFKAEPIEYLVLPHDAYAHSGGRDQTIAAVFEKTFREICGLGAVTLVQAKSLVAGARMNRQAIMHNLLAVSPDGAPFLQVHKSCRNLIRTLPTLVYSETKPEDIDEHAEDHAYDSETYGLMTIMERESYVISHDYKPKKAKDGLMLNEQGQMEGNTIEIGKAIYAQQNKGDDWRYR